MLPSVVHVQHLAKISFFKLEGIMDEISYERRVYESVDDKSLFRDVSQKSTENRIHAAKV